MLYLRDFVFAEVRLEIMLLIVVKLEYKKEKDSRYLKLTFNNQTVPQVLKFVETNL